MAPYKDYRNDCFLQGFTGISFLSSHSSLIEANQAFINVFCNDLQTR